MWRWKVQDRCSSTLLVVIGEALIVSLGLTGHRMALKRQSKAWSSNVLGKPGRLSSALLQLGAGAWPGIRAYLTTYAV